MKKLILIALIAFSFAQVPDSTIVNRMTALETEFNKNKEIIVKRKNLTEKYEARQKEISAQYRILNELITSKVEEEDDL